MGRGRSLAESQAGVDDTGVVVYQHRAVGQQSRQVGEDMLGERPVMVAHQQFAGVARLDRMAGNHRVRKRVIKLLYPEGCRRSMRLSPDGGSFVLV